MSNPEFKRNLWLSFSTHRLIGMPALLALTFLAIALADLNNEVAENIYVVSISLFIFIVWLWGGRNANASIVDEMRDTTWDQQRMSALDPWRMTWGKLFGSTAYNWYGGLMCLIVIALSAGVAEKTHVLSTLLILCAVGVSLHASLIAINLHTGQFESRLVQRGGVGWMGIVWVFLVVPPLLSLLMSSGRDANKFVVWWGMEVETHLFVMDTTLLFAACATFAAWRVMCNALQVRTLPWAWPLFACLLAFLFAGYARREYFAQPLLLSGLFVSVTLSYAALLSEPNTLLRWRKLRLLRQREDWRGWLEHLPLWPTTLLTGLLFALLIALTNGDSFSADSGIVFMRPAIALSIALMLLRDACILLFFSFAPNNKRAVGTTLLYLLVLNMLLPLLADIADLETLRFFLLPFDNDHAPWSSVLVMSLHAATAFALVNWRLRNAKQP